MNLKKDLDEFKHKLLGNNQILPETNPELKNCVSEIRDEINNENEIDSEVKSKLGQNIEDSTKMTDEMSSKVTGMELELNDKFEKLADDTDERMNNVVQNVQVEDEKCTEELLKRQGEKAAQLNIKSKDFQNELLDGLNMTQVKEVTLIQDKTSNSQISPAETAHGIVIKSPMKILLIVRVYICLRNMNMHIASELPGKILLYIRETNLSVTIK
jgi:hypothetical protein